MRIEIIIKVNFYLKGKLHECIIYDFNNLKSLYIRVYENKQAYDETQVSINCLDKFFKLIYIVVILKKILDWLIQCSSALEYLEKYSISHLYFKLQVFILFKFILFKT
jgi:hypothetical protein